MFHAERVSIDLRNGHENLPPDAPPLAGREDVTSIGLLAKATLDNTAAEGKE